MRDNNDSLKVEEDASHTKQKRSRSRSASRSSTGSNGKYVNANLPLDGAEYKIWRNVYLPTLVELMTLADDPWSLEVDYTQAAWDVVFPDKPEEITASGPIYCLVELILLL